MAATSSTCCFGRSSRCAACPARHGARPDGSRPPIDWPSSASTRSATPGRHGCAATARPTCRDSPPPRTGAIRAARSAMRTSSLVTSGIWLMNSRAWGIAGGKLSMTEILQQHQCVDFPPPRAGRNFFIGRFTSSKLGSFCQKNSARSRS
jgi:hypothetical protein